MSYKRKGNWEDGGVRLKYRGKTSLQNLAFNLYESIMQLDKEFEIAYCGSMNLYLHLYDKMGERLFIIGNRDGFDDEFVTAHTVKQVVELNGFVETGDEDPSWCRSGYELHTAEIIHKMIKSYQEKERLELEEKLHRQSEIHDKFHSLHKQIMVECGVDGIKACTKSTAILDTKEKALRFLDDSEIPDQGLCFRITLKNIETGEKGDIRIYDEDLNLIKTISPAVAEVTAET